MPTIHSCTITHIIAAVLLLASACTAAAGVRLMATSVRLGRSLELVRGIRVVIVALVAGLGGLGLLSGRSGFLVIGALILAEELYETGLLALVIRRGDAAACSEDGPLRSTM